MARYREREVDSGGDGLETNEAVQSMTRNVLEAFTQYGVRKLLCSGCQFGRAGGVEIGVERGHLSSDIATPIAEFLEEAFGDVGAL